MTVLMMRNIEKENDGDHGDETNSYDDADDHPYPNDHQVSTLRSDGARSSGDERSGSRSSALSDDRSSS